MEVCGARVMMDAPSSVQKRIRDECTDAKYFAHCSSHIAINLVIVNRCNAIPEAENTNLPGFFMVSGKLRTKIWTSMSMYENEDVLLECARHQASAMYA